MYRIYKPWNTLVKEVDTIEEVMEWVHKNYPEQGRYHYKRVRERDKECTNGRILCWQGVEVKKGIDEMTDYTSF